MADFGLYSGLAVRGNTADMIGDMERHDIRMQQNKSLAEAKAKLFADSMTYQNSANSFDNPIIKKHNEAIIQEIGTYYKNNPDARYNPDKLLFIEQKRRGMLDNEHTLRSKATDEAFTKMNQYLEEVKKNPESYDQEAMQEYLNQKQEYLKHGNQFGLEAREKEGMKPFIFNPPPKFEPDLAKTLQGLGKGIGQYDIQKNEDGDYWRVPNKESVNAIKTGALQRYKRQLQQDAKKAGITDPTSVDKWVEEQVVSGFDKEYHVGDPDAKFKRQMAMANYDLDRQKFEHQKRKERGEQSANFSAFDETFRTPAGYTDPEATKVTWGTNPKIIMYGKSTGKPIDLTGKDFFSDNRFITSNGTKFITGHLKLSKEEAEKYGIYKQGALTIDGVTDDFTGVASEETITDKDGKTTEYIKVKYQLPVDMSKQARMRYDATVQPAKTVDVPSVTQNTVQQSYNTSIASLKKAGYNDAQIQQGVNQGIFIIK